MLSNAIRHIVVWKNQVRFAPQGIIFAMYLYFFQVALEVFYEILQALGFSVYTEKITLGLLVIASLSVLIKCYLIYALAYTRRAFVNVFFTYTLCYWLVEIYYFTLPMLRNSDLAAIVTVEYLTPDGIIRAMSIGSSLIAAYGCYGLAESRAWLAQGESFFNLLVRSTIQTALWLKKNYHDAPQSIKWAVLLLSLKILLWSFHDTVVFLKEVQAARQTDFLLVNMSLITLGMLAVIMSSNAIKVYLIREILQAKRGMRDLYSFFCTMFWLSMASESYPIINSIQASELVQQVVSNFSIDTLLLTFELIGTPYLLYLLYWNIDSQVWFSPHRSTTQDETQAKV